MLERDVFCGPSMVFTNVYNPQSAVNRKDEYQETVVKMGATLEQTAQLSAESRWKHAFIGAGAVVNKMFHHSL